MSKIGAIFIGHRRQILTKTAIMEAIFEGHFPKIRTNSDTREFMSQNVRSNIKRGVSLDTRGTTKPPILVPCTISRLILYFFSTNSTANRASETVFSGVTSPVDPPLPR